MKPSDELPYVHAMLELAKSQRDPIGVDWWQMEELRLTNPTLYEQRRAERAAAMRDEADYRNY